MKKTKDKISIASIEFRSSCPVASMLDIVGDKWTLLVVRDLFLNKHRYGEFLESPEAVPTNILAGRLKKLEACGLIKRVLYQDNPPRAEYYLTTRGGDLAPMLRAMLEWAKRYLPDIKFPDKFYPPDIRD